MEESKYCSHALIVLSINQDYLLLLEYERSLNLEKCRDALKYVLHDKRPNQEQMSISSSLMLDSLICIYVALGALPASIKFNWNLILIAWVMEAETKTLEVPLSRWTLDQLLLDDSHFNKEFPTAEPASNHGHSNQ